MKKLEVIHIYMMPGMAANTSIFDFIQLGNAFEIHRLAWFTPKKDESLVSYATKMCEKSHIQTLYLLVFLLAAYWFKRCQKLFLAVK